MNDELMFFEGLDEAVTGTCMTWHGDILVQRVVYDGNKMIELISKADGMTEEEADEFIFTNMTSSYVGEATPIIMWKASAEEINK